jgi:hypothetical protein
MTLPEVLIALFVLALGSLALLTLFPVAALNMANAVKEERAAQAAANAFAIAEERGVRSDGFVVSNFSGPSATGPSAPLYVDPFGPPSAVGGIITRVTPSYTPDFPSKLRWFSLLDDVIFDDTGAASLSFGSVRRDNRFSWAYLVRRPLLSCQSVVDVTVVVYAGRPLVPTGPTGETLFANSSGAAGSKTIVVSGGNGIHKGSWVLDPINAVFYQVVQTADTALGLQLEVQTSLTGNVTQVVAMDNVVGVFTKGPGWQP